MQFTEKDKERFWEKVEKTEGCWLWKGSLNHNGYGQFSLNNRPVRTHRASWILARNTIPDGHLIRHKCVGNRCCVNPEHLESGTAKDNANDRVRDGTHPFGELSSRAKLTEAQVREIRGRSDELHTLLGIEFGVSRSSIGLILDGKNWKHIL